MADMIAIDMRMPTSCAECRFEGKKDGWTICKLNEFLDANPHDRPKGCPLREVVALTKREELPHEYMEGAVLIETRREIARDIGRMLEKEDVIEYREDEVTVLKRFIDHDKPVEVETAKLTSLSGKILLVKPRPPVKEET